MVPAALDRLDDVGEPEALPEEVVDEHARLDLGLASDPVTVQAMRPRAAPSVLLRPDGYAGAASGEPARHGQRAGRRSLPGCTHIFSCERRDV